MKGGKFKQKVKQLKEEEEEEVGKYMLVFISLIKKQGSRKWGKVI